VHELAVTAIGADRPGIVATVARVLHDHGGNLEDSAMTILGGHFAIVLLVATEQDEETLRAALTEATAEMGLTVSVSRADGRRKPVDATHLLSVYGTDRPGIVARVTETLASVGANITDLETQVIGEGDEAVYAMVIELVAPEDEELADRLSGVCDELGVDHTLRSIEAETY
jgi:glycine cleavage system transcriptional repressor